MFLCRHRCGPAEVFDADGEMIKGTSPENARTFKTILILFPCFFVGHKTFRV
jgi:hypothetical protein